MKTFTAGTKVELATCDDLPELILLCAEDPHAPGWTDAQWKATVSANGLSREGLCRVALVMRHPSGVAGLCVSSCVAGEAELELIVVAKTYRRRGVGRRLLQAAELWAAAQGAATLQLEVRRSNTVARSFYSAESFQSAGERRAYYRDPVESAVLLTKALRDVAAAAR